MKLMTMMMLKIKKEVHRFPGKKSKADVYYPLMKSKLCDSAI